jgi:hypothetical protein
MNGGEIGVDCGGPCAHDCPSGMEGDGERCRDYLPGEPCSVNVAWALSDGIVNHPEWYEGSGLSPKSDKRAMQQAWLAAHSSGPTTQHDAACCRAVTSQFCPCSSVRALGLTREPCRHHLDSATVACRSVTAWSVCRCVPRYPPCNPRCSLLTPGSSCLLARLQAECLASDGSADLSCTTLCVKNLRDFIDGCATAIYEAGLADHLEQQIFGCGGITGSLDGASNAGSLGSCDVTCVGKVFTAGSRNGDAVCGHEVCGTTSPFVGLDTFGCSDQSVFWGGVCCNTNTCPPKR